MGNLLLFLQQHNSIHLLVLVIIIGSIQLNSAKGFLIRDNSKHTERHHGGMCKMTTANDYNNNLNRIVIPIFPLRKRVKFPGELVQLTLWEQRYRALAQFILNNQQHRHTHNHNYCNYFSFGVLYASHKPQIITNNADAPITPMIDKGDVGVLCLVKEYTMFQNDKEIAINTGDFPMIGTDNDGTIVKDTDDWNKIRLIGLGVSRFRVEKIISKGYNNYKSSEGEPFIIVEASLVEDSDDTLEHNNYDEELSTDGRINKERKIITIIESKKKLVENPRMKSSYEKFYKHYEQYREIYNTNNNDNELRMIQLWTFSIISQLTETRKCPSNEVLTILATTSLQDRINYICNMLKI